MISKIFSYVNFVIFQVETLNSACVVVTPSVRVALIAGMKQTTTSNSEVCPAGMS